MQSEFLKVFSSELECRKSASSYSFCARVSERDYVEFVEKCNECWCYVEDCCVEDSYRDVRVIYLGFLFLMSEKMILLGNALSRFNYIIS